MATAETIPNSMNVNEFLSLQTELIDSQRAIDKATGAKRAILKRAKNMGADLDAMALLRRLAKMPDDARTLLLETTQRYAGWEGVKLFRAGDAERPQGSMFDDEADEPTPAVKQGHRDALITSDAYNTRKEGGPADDNPHDPGTRDHQTWSTAWLDADREFASLAPGVTVPSTAARGRGRPKGSKNRENGAAA